MRTGTVPGQTGPRRTEVQERHPLVAAAAKWLLVTLLAGLVSGGAWLLIDQRDAVRDVTREVDELPRVKDRLRRLEDVTLKQTVIMERIDRRTERIEERMGP